MAIFSYLDSKDKNLLEYKLDTFSSVYRNLTGTSSPCPVAPVHR